VTRSIWITYMKLLVTVKRYIPRILKNSINKIIEFILMIQNTIKHINYFVTYSYSQEGEDKILLSLFGINQKKNGFYVDVGAHHPKRYSNTYISYLAGWTGINIDANHEAIKLFNKFRPRDINLAIGVSEKSEKLTFHVFDEPALNTFDQEVAFNIINNSNFKKINELILEVMPLSRILDLHLPKGQVIDFLNIDVEGKDLDVLKSNDWSKYIPLYILIEIHSDYDQEEGFSFDEILNSDITIFLKSKGYIVFAKTLNTVFYKFSSYTTKSEIKVFSYKLPKKYCNQTTNLRIPSETYHAISDFFKNSLFTEDPTNADYFFVPINLIQYQFENDDPINLIKELAYFSEKRDHILIATGDYSQRGKSNHFGQAYKKPYDWLGNFMLLALESTSDLIVNQDIGIIPINTLIDFPYFNENERIFLYSFLGQIRHKFLPHNHVRSKMINLENQSDTLIISKLKMSTKKRLTKNLEHSISNDYELLARNSTFTLAPAGYGKWTYRFFQSIQWGSIPILFSDDYIKPFQKYIPYDSFTITLPENEILNVDKILRNISPTQVLQYQENLRKNQHKFTRQAFFDMLTQELEDKKNIFSS